MIDAWILHFATDGEGALYNLFLSGRNEEDIVLLQWDIWSLAVHDAGDVYTYYFERAVRFHAVHYGTVSECLLSQSFGMLYKGAYAVDFFAEIVHARTEYGSFHLYGVGVAWQDAVYAD